MEHDKNLTGYLDGDLSEAETKEITEHLKTCKKCRDQLEDLQKAIQLFSTVFKNQPDFLKNIARNTDEKISDEKIKVTCDTPLPDAIKERLSKKRTDIRERLSQVLHTLKTYGESTISDLVQELESLAQGLVDSTPETEPSFALQRDTTMPVQTDLELRYPETFETEELRIDEFTIEIKKLTSKTQIRITREDKPVGGLKIKIKNNSGKIVTQKTDQDGVCHINPLL